MLIVMALSLRGRADRLSARRWRRVDLSPSPRLGPAVRAGWLIWCLAPSSSRRLIGNVSAEPDLVYFSIMTLTTAGYGDIVPGHPSPRALASLEAIVWSLVSGRLPQRFRLDDAAFLTPPDHQGAQGIMHAPNNAKVYSSPTTPADMCPVFSATVCRPSRPRSRRRRGQPAVEAPQPPRSRSFGCRPALRR